MSQCLSIAVLDDDDQLREDVLVDGLRQFGFQVQGASTAAQLYRLMLSHHFDMVVLDVNLPDEDGITVAHHLHALNAQLGILMLSAQDEDAERIASLECGADGYLVKPTSPELLAATLHSLWRRIRPPAPAADAAADPGLDADGWYLPAGNGSVIPLSRSERRLIHVLLGANGQAVERNRIIDYLAEDSDGFDPGRLDVLVHRLRRKLAESARSGLEVVTVRGIGYALLRH